MLPRLALTSWVQMKPSEELGLQRWLVVILDVLAIPKCTDKASSL